MTGTQRGQGPPRSLALAGSAGLTGLALIVAASAPVFRWYETPLRPRICRPRIISGLTGLVTSPQGESFGSL